MNKFLNKGLLATVLASFLYGAQSIFFRLIGTELGLFYPFVIRGLSISLILTSYLYLTHTYKKISRKDYKWFLLMPMSGVSAFVIFFLAVNNINVGTALFLHYAGLVITGFVLGYLIFKEKLNQLKLLSLFLSLIGLFLIFATPQLQNDLWYPFLALISGIGASLWNLFSKKISSKYSYAQILAIDSGVVFFITTILSIVTSENFHPPKPNLEWASVVGMTTTSLGAYILSVYGFRFLQAQIASLILLLEVVFGAFLAWILFSEIPTVQTLIGGILILTGAVISNFSSNN